MKKFLLILTLVFTLNSYAQEKAVDLIESSLNILNIKKENCLSEFILLQEISPTETLILIPEIEDEGEGFMELNPHILIVENKTGTIKSRFSEKKSWFSGAVRLHHIKLMYQPFQLTKNSETIGVFIRYYGNSRPNPYSSTELSLFIRENDALVRVLKDFPIFTLHGETDGRNSGEFEEGLVRIEPNLNSKTKFYDLKIMDSIVKTQSLEGENIKTEISKKFYTLTYKDGKYSIAVKQP